MFGRMRLILVVQSGTDIHFVWISKSKVVTGFCNTEEGQKRDKTALRETGAEWSRRSR